MPEDSHRLNSVELVRVHSLIESTHDQAPHSVWIVEFTDVDWRPPDDWDTEIGRILSGSNDDAVVDHRLTSSSDQFEIFVKTKERGAQLIIDQRRVVEALEKWTGHTNQAQRSRGALSGEDAERLVLDALQTHFGVSPQDILSIDREYEEGDEYQIRIMDSASEQFTGTARHEGSHVVTHLVRVTDL